MLGTLKSNKRLSRHVFGLDFAARPPARQTFQATKKSSVNALTDNLGQGIGASKLHGYHYRTARNTTAKTTHQLQPDSPIVSRTGRPAIVVVHLRARATRVALLALLMGTGNFVDVEAPIFLHRTIPCRSPTMALPDSLPSRDASTPEKLPLD